MSLLRRQQALAEVMAKWNGIPFVWGRHDCGRLAAAMVKAMGHKLSLAAFGLYESERGALRALKRAGFDGLEAAVDARLHRIAPARALIGDIIGLAGEGGTWPALTLYLGNGAVLGFLDGECTAMRVKEYRTAWSVTCLR